MTSANHHHSILEGLNPEQKKAALSIEGPVLILAGAGSGKTKTVTHRIAYMLRQGIPGQNILAVSFTNKASLEMKERVQRLLGSKRLMGLTISTFHALGIHILRKEIHQLNYRSHFTIYDTSDQLALIREILHHQRGEKNFDRKILQAKISFLKNRAISAQDFAQSPHFRPDDEYDQLLLDVYPIYQEKLQFFNAIDFDDILHLTVKVLENPETARKYSELYRYVLIDEYQDTNPLQLKLIQQLTYTHNNICVVGDDDQAIYGFRGADVHNILQFENQYPGCQVIKLEQNYRSTMPILSLANKVMEGAQQRKKKTLWSEYSSPEKPYLWICGSHEHEASEIVEDINRQLKSGLDPRKVAVIYRSNAQAQIIEEQLRMHQVPYTMIGGQKFYDKKEIKDLISYLALIENIYDEIALRRIINTPSRGIGQATLKRCIELVETRKISFYQAIQEYIRQEEEGEKTTAAKNKLQQFFLFIQEMRQQFSAHSLSSSLEVLVEKLQFKTFIEQSHPQVKQQMRRKRDVEVFIQSAKRFEEVNSELRPPLKYFLERVLLADMQDKQSEDDGQQLPTITLLTLHSSKGLEFDMVYLVGVEEELLPHKKTLSELTDTDEERRLCYVGITRARKKLIMTYCKERKLYGRDVPRLKSRFLKDLDPFYQIQDRTGFNHLSKQEEEEYKNDFFENLINKL